MNVEHVLTEVTVLIDDVIERTEELMEKRGNIEAHTARINLMAARTRLIERIHLALVST